MAITKPTEKKKKPQLTEEEIIKRIEKGGSPAKEEQLESTSKEELASSEKAFQLRMPMAMLKLVDERRTKGMVKTSRNKWILQAIVEKLEKDNS